MQIEFWHLFVYGLFNTAALIFIFGMTLDNANQIKRHARRLSQKADQKTAQDATK